MERIVRTSSLCTCSNSFSMPEFSVSLEKESL